MSRPERGRSAPLVRPAIAADARAVAEIDHETWSPTVTPAPRWPADHDPLAGADLGDFLIAECDGRPGGYLKLGPATPLASSAHVLQIQSVAVSPACQRRGIAAALMAAALDAARARGASRVTLRVLAVNTPARALYAAAGFEVEGVLRGEFLLEGEYVDDVLMAVSV